MVNISIFPQSSQYCGPQVCKLCGFEVELPQFSMSVPLRADTAETCSETPEAVERGIVEIRDGGH